MFDGLKSAPPSAYVADALLGTLARALGAGELAASIESVLVEVRREEDQIVASVVDPASSRLEDHEALGQAPSGHGPCSRRAQARGHRGAPLAVRRVVAARRRPGGEPAADQDRAAMEALRGRARGFLRRSLDVFISVAANGKAALSAAGALAKGISSICALMVGPPGVGKSICAEAVAQALGRPLRPGAIL